MIDEIETQIEYPVHYHGHIEMFIDTEKENNQDVLQKIIKDFGEDADLLGI